MTESDHPTLTPKMRARIVEAVGKRKFARQEYSKSNSESEIHRNAVALRRATEALESADMVEALMAEVERLEKCLGVKTNAG